MAYFQQIAVFFAFYAILAVSLDLLAGHTGLLSIAHAAFYGIGAYTSAILTVRCGVPFSVGLVAGMALAAVLSLGVSLPSLRLQDDYFVIATFGFQMIALSVLNNWIAVTRGPMGIPGIPQPVILGWHIDTNGEFLFLAAVFAAIAHFTVWLIVTSPYGRVLHAIREDEVFAKALGKNTLRFKVTVFAVSAALAAAAGSLYAHYITYIDPTNFTVMESILMLAMVIIGGASSTWGPLIGAFVLVTLPEALRFVGFPVAVAASVRQVVYGTLLMTMMVFRPRGIVGRYALGQSSRTQPGNVPATCTATEHADR